MSNHLVAKFATPEVQDNPHQLGMVAIRHSSVRPHQVGAGLVKKGIEKHSFKLSSALRHPSYLGLKCSAFTNLVSHRFLSIHQIHSYRVHHRVQVLQEVHLSHLDQGGLQAESVGLIEILTYYVTYLVLPCRPSVPEALGTPQDLDAPMLP